MSEEKDRFKLEDILEQPKKVEVDGRSVEQFSLKEIIELDRYLASKKAVQARAGKNLLNISRFTAGGAV